MKKQYSKGYNYELHTASLIRPSMIVLSNTLPYGKGRLEAQIFIERGSIRVLITNGFDNLYDKQGFLSLKQAMNIAHGNMVKLNKEWSKPVRHFVAVKYREELQPSEAVQQLINEYATKL